MRTYSLWNISVVLFGLILIIRLGQIVGMLALINNSLQQIQAVLVKPQKSTPEQTEPQKSTPEQTEPQKSIPEQTDTPVRE